MPSTKRKASNEAEGEKGATSNDGDSAVAEHVNTSRHFIPRYTGPEESELTEEQKTIRQNILESRPRTGLNGPFGPWLAVPAIAQPAQELGRAVRYGTSLTFKESELVILLTGAKFQSRAEFDIHVGEAIKAGWSINVIQAIPRDDFSLQAVKDNVVPLLEDSKREVAIALFTAELLEKCTVCDETYEATKAALDNKDSVIMEITSISGYYAYVAFTLNVFNIPSK